jgi:hypothetical protein
MSQPIQPETKARLANAIFIAVPVVMSVFMAVALAVG